MITSQKSGLHILVFGAGAIGSYIGGSLSLHGHKVVFLERESVAHLLRQRGITLEIGNMEYHIPKVSVETSLEKILQEEPFDIAIFTLKSYDTLAALETIKQFANILPPILCLQNGVENEAALASVLGIRNVIAGSVTTAIGRKESGAIVVERMRGIGVADDHNLSKLLVDAMNAANLNACLYPIAADMKWSKMLTNLLANATSAILGMTPAEIFSNPQLYLLEVNQLREAIAVMASQGIHVIDLPKTPVRTLAFMVHSLPAFISRPLAARILGKGRGNKMPSFYIDLHSQRGQSEVDYLNGAVARFGDRLGIPTPVNHILTQILTGMTQGNISIDSYAHETRKLVNALGAVSADKM